MRCFQSPMAVDTTLGLHLSIYPLLDPYSHCIISMPLRPWYNADKKERKKNGKPWVNKHVVHICKCNCSGEKKNEWKKKERKKASDIQRKVLCIPHCTKPTHHHANVLRQSKSSPFSTNMIGFSGVRGKMHMGSGRSGPIKGGGARVETANQWHSFHHT